MPGKYIVDANVYMQAARQYYAFDLVPKFWDCLVANATDKAILSIDRIHDEIMKGKDTLSHWAASKCLHAFESTNDAQVIAAFGEAMNWVSKQDFTPGAKAQFASCADGWLVAYGKTYGRIVVTLETYDPTIKKRVKIPNVCKALNIPYTDPFTMLRDVGAKIG